jgi:Tol biopolymer transport system component
VVVLEEPTRSVISFTESEEDVPKPFTDGAADEHSPALSPDGRWLAYVSDGDVWVAAFPGKRDREQVSVDGGAEPRWARGGNELFFRAGDSLYVAEIRDTSGLDIGRSVALFSVEAYAPGLRAANYDVSADGERFVFVKQLGDRPQYVVVERNWVRKLRDLVGER